MVKPHTCVEHIPLLSPLCAIACAGGLIVLHGSPYYTTCCYRSPLILIYKKSVYLHNFEKRSSNGLFWIRNDQILGTNVVLPPGNCGRELPLTLLAFPTPRFLLYSVSRELDTQKMICVYKGPVDQWTQCRMSKVLFEEYHLSKIGFIFLKHTSHFHVYVFLLNFMISDST